MRGRWLTVLLLTICVGGTVVVVAPSTVPDAALVIIPSLLTFIVGFCRGYWMSEQLWMRNAHRLAQLLERDGVPVAIVAPPGGSYLDPGRPL